MKEYDPFFLETYSNIRDFPLVDHGGKAYQILLERVKDDLKTKGCSLLPGFIKPEFHDRIEREGELVAPHAYYKKEVVNAYNTPPTSDLPADHPAQISMMRENAFVARDLIPETDIINHLHQNQFFSRFLADCFGYDKLYQLADPLAGLCLNVLKPGCCHPWHYDINEFTVSLLTKKPQAGGEFRFSPGIRSSTHENVDLVRQILLDDEEADEHVTNLTLEVGDLQLFQGRYSLHQVSPVQGNKERHTAILAYTLEPGVIGDAERTRQLFGRVLPAHLKRDCEIMTSSGGLNG